MAKISYTKAQESAIYYSGGNLLLSAAAGSGKTATLTARILHLLIHGDANGEVNLTDMLSVTYTRAAAGELRGRIGAAILDAERDWAGESGENLSAPTVATMPTMKRSRFFRHIADVQRADISTIHSFLLKVLRPYFPTLGLSPDMSVMDESAAKVLKGDAMRDTVDDFFNHPRQSDSDHTPDNRATFFELADALGAARDADALDTVLIDMADALTSAGREADCLYDYADLLEADAEGGFFQSVYGAYIREHIRLMLRHYRTVLSDLGDEILLPGSKLAEKYGPALSAMLNLVCHAEDGVSFGDYSSVREILTSYTPVALGRLGAKDKTEASEAFKSVRDRFKKDLADLNEHYFTAEEADLAISMRRSARILRCLGDVLSAYDQSFSRRKRAQNALDYADLERYALKLFLDENHAPTAAAKEVGERYKYIFIDEYQDTNHVQDEIFRAISTQSVRFMVGDIKQSIYRFRGAEPEVFSGYRDRWPVLREGGAAEQFSHDGGQCIFMSENFRCDEPVVRFVNMVSGYMFPFGGIPYTADDALIFAKGNDLKQKVEICLIEKPRKMAAQKKTRSELAENGGLLEETSSDAVSAWDDTLNPEAEYVANRIAAMIGTPLREDEAPVKASDIAIITRNLKGTADVYGEALMRRGIQVRLKTQVTPLSAKSASLALCILNLVDNPLREIYAAGAMRSPVFGFTTDDIVLLKQFGGEMSLETPLYIAVTRVASYRDPSCAEGYQFTAEPDSLSENVPDGADESSANDMFANEAACLAEMADTVDGEAALPEGISEALAEKCVRLVHWVKRHKTVSRGMKADKYIEYLYNELKLTSIPEIFGEAAERDALNRLYEMARRYESGRFGGISGFLAYINENAESENTEVGEENAVSIVSIHASKGLEYPVCFLVECGKERNRADEKKNLLFDPALGFGMTLPDEGGLVRCDTAVRRGIAEKKREDAINEEMRVLYVALTRARSKLILTAKTADAAALLDHAEREKSYVTEWSVRECGSYRDLVVRAAAKFGAADFYETKVIGLNEIHPYFPEEQAALAHPSTGEEDTAESDSAAIRAALEENFRFQYPLDFLRKIPSKLNVSGLSPHILDEDDGGMADSVLLLPRTVSEEEAEEERSVVPLPSFMTGMVEKTGAARGTATHLFMQFMNLNGLRKNGVDAELGRLVAEKYLSPETADLVNRAHMEHFRESALFHRMCAAEAIWREFRFNVLMPAADFTSDVSLAEQLRSHDVKVTVQGVVDCVFRDEAGLILVDYKTDAMTRQEYTSPQLGAEKLLRRHRDQLLYYRAICTRLFDAPIAETLLYSTSLARAITVE